MGSKVNFGSFGVTKVKSRFSLKCIMSSLLYSVSMKLTCISLRPYIIFFGWRSTWGHFRRQGLPAVPATISSFVWFCICFSVWLVSFQFGLFCFVYSIVCHFVSIFVFFVIASVSSFFFFLFLSSFCQHCYFSYSLHVMTMWLTYIHELDDRYKSYGSRNSPGVIWGHRG